MNGFDRKVNYWPEYPPAGNYQGTILQSPLAPGTCGRGRRTAFEQDDAGSLARKWPGEGLRKEKGIAREIGRASRGGGCIGGWGLG